MGDRAEKRWNWGWNGDMCAVWGACIVLGDGKADKEAKAALIAAAPDLLVALQIMTRLVRLRYGNLDADVDAEVQKAMAAIAKASGEAP